MSQTEIVKVGAARIESIEQLYRGCYLRLLGLALALLI